MTKPAFLQRAFLNDAEAGGIAFFEARIEEPCATHDGLSQHFDAGFKLGDCHRTVELDFGVWDDAANVRQKALRLRRGINTFVDTLLRQCDEVDAFAKRAKK